LAVAVTESGALAGPPHRVPPTDAERVADALTVAFEAGQESVAKVFAAHLAERVEVVHSPGQPQDGLYDSVVVAAAQAAQADRLSKILSRFTQAAAVSARAAEVTVRLHITGTLPDDTAVTINGTDVLTIADGRIIRLLSTVDCEQLGALVAALTQQSGLDSRP
jgi:glucose-6-phosphate dehydrogenase assembly protein OpcA